MAVRSVDKHYVIVRAVDYFCGTEKFLVDGACIVAEELFDLLILHVDLRDAD